MAGLFLYQARGGVQLFLRGNVQPGFVATEMLFPGGAVLTLGRSADNPGAVFQAFWQRLAVSGGYYGCGCSTEWAAQFP